MQSVPLIRMKNNAGARSLDEIEPAEDMLLVRLFEQSELESGIVLPNGDDAHEPMARVVKVGPGRWTDSGKFINQTYRPGDIVYYRQTDYLNYKEHPVMVGDEMLWLLKPAVVVAYIRREASPKYLEGQTDFISS